jgi:hypothetical protein
MERNLARLKAATYNDNKEEISILRMKFEPTITLFERSNAVHALTRAATEIGVRYVRRSQQLFIFSTNK